MKTKQTRSRAHCVLVPALALAILLAIMPVGQAIGQQLDGTALPPAGMQAQAVPELVRRSTTSPAEETVTDLATVISLESVADTEIWGAYPTDNYGDESAMYIGYANYYPDHVLLDIPLWNLPPGASIDSVILRFALAGWYDYPGTSRTITAYRVTSLWHEMLATWNKAPTLGESVGAVAIGTPDLSGDAVWYGINVTSLAQAWYNGALPNFGIILVGPEGGDPVYRAIASSETTLYPRLEVAYTLAAPTLSVAPATLAFLTDDTHPLSQTQPLRISNTGSQPFQWQADIGTSSWITLSVVSGTVNAGYSQAIDVYADRTGLVSGTYTSQIQITSSTPGVQGVPHSVPVTLYYGDLDSVYLPLVSRDYSGGASDRAVVILLIGIADYKYLEPPSATGSRAGVWGYDLFYARNDALRAKMVLDNLGGGRAGNALVLTESDASLAAIQAAFAWVDALEDQDTTVVVAYSGHGGRVADDNGDESDGLDEFIAAYDTNDTPPPFVNIIRDDDLDAMLSTLESDHVAVLLDTCYGGGMIDTAAAGQLPRGLAQLAAPFGVNSPQALDGMVLDVGKPGRVILAASQNDQTSGEYSDLNHGVFTYYLLMALQDPAADSDRNGWVSAEEAHAYLAPRVDAYAHEYSEHQNPQIYDGVAGGVDIAHP